LTILFNSFSSVPLFNHFVFFFVFSDFPPSLAQFADRVRHRLLSAYRPSTFGAQRQACLTLAMFCAYFPLFLCLFFSPSWSFFTSIAFQSLLLKIVPKEANCLILCLFGYVTGVQLGPLFLLFV
jgi:hypothetical protein